MKLFIPEFCLLQFFFYYYYKFKFTACDWSIQITVFPSLSLGRSHVCRNLCIFTRLSILLAYNWSEYSHDILYLCSVFFVCLFVCLPFIQFMRFSWQVYWGGLSFPPPVDHVLLELSAMTRPSWVALHSMAHSFIELCKPLHHDKAVIHEGDH